MLGSLAAAQSPSPSGTENQIVMHQLTPNIYWAEGGVGNTGLIVGESGAIVIDAKMTAVAAREMLGAVAKVTSKPVVAVILTHSDWDHIGGLSAFPEGIQIIAQQNCADYMRQLQNRSGAGSGSSPGGAQGDRSIQRLPNRIVTSQREDVEIAGVRMELLHWAPAHTGGNLVIYLPAEKIVFAGDILTENPSPLIHLEEGGTSAGWIATAQGMTALDAKLFVGGHTEPFSAAAAREYVAAAAAKRAKIAGLVAQGKTLAEIKAVLNDPVAVAGQGHPAFPTFTDVVYKELTGR